MNNNKNSKPDRGEPRKRSGSDSYDRRPIVDTPTSGNRQAAQTAAVKRKGFYIILLLGITAIGIYAVISALLPNNDTGKNNNDPSVSAISSTALPDNASVAANADTLPIDESEPIPDSTAAASPSAAAQSAESDSAVQTLGQAPVSGKIIKDFSDTDLMYSNTMRDWRTHAGVDIAANMDTPVTAVKDGVLKKVYEDSLFGTTVVIHHDDDGTDSIYSNLKDATTEPIGTPIQKGTVIGKIGKTAVSETDDEPHLHFEIKLDDTFLDPKQFVEFESVDYVPEATGNEESSATASEATPNTTASATVIPTDSSFDYGDDAATMIID